MTSKTGNQLRCHKGLIPSGKKLYPDRSVHGIYFPSKGVRYIAINDNVDTINGESELAPFLNILNEMHARQTSKVESCHAHKICQWRTLWSLCTAGLCKRPGQKGHLLIDPETRWIVEKILTLLYTGVEPPALHGFWWRKSTYPGWLNYERYGTFANIYAGAPAEKPMRGR